MKLLRHVAFCVGLVMNFCVSTSYADVSTVDLRIPEDTAWTGQRVPVFVDIRIRGSFGGATSFSLPTIPQAVMVQIGNPVIGSEELDGESWFVQTHEFALFSQRSGEVTIPPFEVRFGQRDGFTGPIEPRTEKTPAAKLQVNRPPASDALGFMITTESIAIDETWSPRPGPANVGDVYTRTISQSADNMTGMALAPPPTKVPSGVRLYPPKSEVHDLTERGAFTGRRSDTLTYVMTEPGTQQLPAVTYVWWNPTTKELLSKTLPSVSFEVAAIPESAPKSVAKTRSHLSWWAMLGVVGLLVVVWRWPSIYRRGKSLWQRLNPPDRVAARQLRHACRRHDAMAAERAWAAWQQSQPNDVHLIDELRQSAVQMQRTLFGTGDPNAWRGTALLLAFEKQLKLTQQFASRRGGTELPRLNP